MSENRTVLSASTVRLIVALTAIVLLYGGSVYYYGKTIISWWIPVTSGATVGIIAAATRIAILHRDKRKSSSWFETAITFVLAGVAGAFLLLCANYSLADKSKLHTEEAEVVAKYSEQHSRSRRVRGRYVNSGSEYQTFHLRLRFADGSEKEFPVSLREYNRTRTGSTHQFNVCPGALGYPVILR